VPSFLYLNNLFERCDSDYFIALFQLHQLHPHRAAAQYRNALPRVFFFNRRADNYAFRGIIVNCWSAETMLAAATSPVFSFTRNVRTPLPARCCNG